MQKQLIVSPLNYTGGKKNLIKTFKELFPNDINCFVDLFCGGCTVGANIPSNEVIFNDAIPELINLYKEFRKRTNEEVLGHIDVRIKEYGLSLSNRDGYNKLRDKYNKEHNPLDLFVLICYGFNHQIRFNSKGEFNIPFGKDRSQFNDTIKKNLVDFLDYLHGDKVSFFNLDFREFDFSGLGPMDFVYCDPPYYVSTATYNSSWGEKEERALLELLDRLNASGVRFALSNVLTNKGEENTILNAWVKERDYTVLHLDKSYANSSYHRTNKNTKSDEVLIYNF